MEPQKRHEALARLSRARPSASVEARIVAGAEARLQAGRTGRSFGWRAAGGVLAGLACVAVAVAVWLGVGSTARHSPAPRWVQTDAESARIRIGSHRVQIDARSKVQVAPAPSGGARLELAEGSVECRVEPLPEGATFSVRAPQATVTVVGTRFRVRANGACTQVQVSEGRVQVAPDRSPVRTVDAGGSVRICYDDDPSSEPAPAPPAVSEAERMREALGKLAAKDLEGARRGFAAYLEAHPEGAFAEDALFHQARLELSLGRPEEARRLLDALRNRFPASRRVKALEAALQN